MQAAGTCGWGGKIVYRSPQIALPNQDKFSKVVISAGGQDALWTNKVQVHQYDKGAPNTGFKHLIPGNWDAGHGRATVSRLIAVIIVARGSLMFQVMAVLLR